MNEIFGNLLPMKNGLSHDEENFVLTHNNFVRWFANGALTIEMYEAMGISEGMLKRKFSSYHEFQTYRPMRWKTLHNDVKW